MGGKQVGRRLLRQKERLTEASGTAQQREGDHQGLSTGLGKRGGRLTNLTQTARKEVNKTVAITFDRAVVQSLLSSVHAAQR